MGIRRGVWVLALAGSLVAAPASAATKAVTVVSYAFQPGVVRAGLGDTVRWENDAGITHSSTRRGVISWSLDIAPGGSRSRVFRQAGTFSYLCRFPHGMSGAVRVPVRATPSSGSSATTFTIRVATAVAPSGTQYVIQRRAPGGSWRAWKTTTAQTVSFRSSTKGTWRFRARVRDTGTGAASGFSPSARVTIG
jgi:plastocyanin